MLRHSTILIVDDTMSVRLFVEKILRQQFNCRDIAHFTCADDAYNYIQSGGEADWIISDWEMPGMKGDEFLLKIRSDHKTSEMPFIMMTSRNDKGAFVTAAQAGVSDYLVKPFTAAVLMQKMRKIFISSERRLLERFKLTKAIMASLVFGKIRKNDLHLEDVSEGGCLVKAQFFKDSESIYIYDEAEIILNVDFGKIQLKGELARIERDRDNIQSRQFIMLAFQFTEIDDKNKMKLKKLVKDLASELSGESGA
ncbi:MAG TPA: response regulator [Nitrospirae bacterium]|nr:response regulator [Nitrospirota bacterium]